MQSGADRHGHKKHAHQASTMDQFIRLWRRRLLLPFAASHAKQENLLLFMYCGLHVCLLVTTMSTIETTKPGHGQTDCYWSDHNCWTPHCFVYTVKGGNETRQHHLISKTCEFSDERRRVLDVVEQTVDVVDTTQASKHHVQTDAADRPDVGAVVRRQWVCHFGRRVVLTACTSDNYAATHNHCRTSVSVPLRAQRSADCLHQWQLHCNTQSLSDVSECAISGAA